jgi:hypothetical protein
VSRPKHGERVHPGQAGISLTKGAHVANPQQTKGGRIPRHREDPAVAARRAGDRGRHAEPMDTDARIRRYVKQIVSDRITNRQERRAQHKRRRQMRRAYEAGAS